MDQKIKVCWYCEKWQPGGIQAVQVNLLEHMDLSRLQLDIVVSQDDTDLFDSRLEALGVRKLVTLDRRYSFPARRVSANILAFHRLLRREHYDAVHLNVCHGVELIYCFCARLCRVPVRIVHCRNNDIGAGGRSRPVKLLAHRICRVLFHNCANRKLANSDLAARWLYPARDLPQVQVLRNGIDARRYAPDPEKRAQIRRELQLDGRFVIGHVGHFSYQKNHEFLLEIFRAAAERCPEASLLLVGQGEGQDRIRALALEYGLADRVIFYGVTNDVPGLMMAMDVFVLPSRFEGFGNVLLEAQASGLPCYASAEVIPRAVAITPSLHFLSLEESPEVWADALLTPPPPRVSQVQAVIHAGHDISAMARSLEQLYLSGKERTCP